MKFAKRNLLAVGLASLLAATGARGQEIPWPEVSYNRQPAAGDLILPMPCGGAMVFRPIDVPGNDIFDDQTIIVGGRDPERAFIENSRRAFIGGTFRTKGAWRYYLGKYEVTEAQYEALNGICPDAGHPEASLPRVKLTMAEAVLATERYTDWLITNAADKLPTEGGAPGYVRLPTEEEWEYAARGGIAVGPADFEARLPPMDGPPEQFIFFCRTDCALELIGLLKPNPLGLHDMHGNASELVHGLFRLNRVARESGGAGAYVKRGGNYLTRLEQTHSGLRAEFSPLAKRSLRREPTTGFRLALAAPALPDRARLEEARRLWGRLAESEKVTLGEERSDPRAELRTLADFAARLSTDETQELNRRLLALVDVVDINIASRNEERARAAREMLRVAVFAGLRLPGHHASIVRCQKLVKLNPEHYKARCEKVRRDSQFDHEFYLDHLVRIAGEFPAKLTSKQFAVLEKEFGARLELALSCVTVVASNLDVVRNKGAEGREEIAASWRNSCGR
jgi:hypothetical protein